MVEEINPKKAIINFNNFGKSLADNRMIGNNSNFIQFNGIDWLYIPATTKQFLDPEEEYQKTKEKNEKIKKTLDGEKLDAFIKSYGNEKEIRDEVNQSTLHQNITNSNKYLAVVEYAQLVLAENQRFFFKKGSLIYNFNGKVYFRIQDILRRDKDDGSMKFIIMHATGDIDFS